MKKLLINYDYKNSSHPERLPFTSAYLLEQALKEYFEVIHDGKADVTFNTTPINKDRPFVANGLTFIFDSESPYHSQADWVYYTAEKKLTLPHSSLLLDATIPEYKYYPNNFIYDLGFLGREFIWERVRFIEEISKYFKVLHGTRNLGEESARELSKCKLVMIIDDFMEMNNFKNWIDRRLFTFGNIRPILVPFNEDYLLIGKPNEHYIPYSGLKSLIQQASYYLSHMEEAEKIGDNLREELKKHSYQARAKEIFEKYENWNNRI